MEATHKNKRNYIQPDIVIISMDIEINLQMESTPPTRDNENDISMKLDSFKSTMMYSISRYST